MSVADGQPVNAAYTNPAFLKPDTDDFTTARLGSHNSVLVASKFVQDIQRYLNNLGTTAGLDTSANYTAEADSTGNTYGSSSNAISNGDSFKAALTKLSNKFASTTGSGGHGHTGVSGDGALINLTSAVTGILPIANGGTGFSSTPFTFDRMILSDSVNGEIPLTITKTGSKPGTSENDALLINHTATTDVSGSGIVAGLNYNFLGGLNQPASLFGVSVSTTTGNNSGGSSVNYLSQWGTMTNGGDAYGFYADKPTGGAASNYAGLYVSGVSSGTVSGFNDAIHVNAGRSYFGGSVNVNGLTASVPVVTDSSKNLASVSYATFTASLSNFVGDSGSGGTKGLVPAPAAGDAAAGKFLKADGSFAVPTGSGDVTGPSSSVDNELVLFSSTTGKVIKRASGTGAVSVTSGVVTQGTLSIANGGTNSTATATAGGVGYGTGTAHAYTTAGTSQNWVLSGGAGSPTMSNTTTTGKTIDGSADETQLLVEGNSTQTNPVFYVRKSDGTSSLLQVTNVNGTSIRGTTTNDDAGVNDVAREETGSLARASATSLSTATAKTVCSITNLAAGDWDVFGVVGFITATTTSVTVRAVSISLTDNATPSNLLVPTGNEVTYEQDTAATVPGNNADGYLTVGPIRVKLASATTVYLTTKSTFSGVGGTQTAYGFIRARRQR